MRTDWFEFVMFIVVLTMCVAILILAGVVGVHHLPAPDAVTTTTTQGR